MPGVLSSSVVVVVVYSLKINSYPSRYGAGDETR